MIQSTPHLAAIASMLDTAALLVILFVIIAPFLPVFLLLLFFFLIFLCRRLRLHFALGSRRRSS